MRAEDKGNILAVCAVALCIMLTLGSCITLSGQGFIGAALFESVDGESVFFVCAGGYTDVALASTTAELIRARGGAGYVLGEDEYELVYAAYPTEDAANGVAEGLGSEVYVRELTIKKSKLKWADKDEKSATLAALEYYRIAFDALYDCANALNAGRMNIEDVKVKIGVLRAQIEDIKCAYWQNTGDNENDNITAVKVAILTAMALVDNLALDGSDVGAMSSMRYAGVQLALSRQALMRSI